MNDRADDLRQLENLLRSVRDDLEYPLEPDVRAGVRGRLADAMSRTSARGSSRRSGETGSTGPATVTVDPQTAEETQKKGFWRQLLEMAAAAVLLVVFIGGLSLIFQSVGSDGDRAASPSPLLTHADEGGFSSTCCAVFGNVGDQGYLFVVAKTPREGNPLRSVLYVLQPSANGEMVEVASLEVPRADSGALVSIPVRGNPAAGIAFANDALYIPISHPESMGIWAVDVSDPENPQPMGITDANQPVGVTASGNLAVVASDGTEDLLIFDISEPSRPQLLSTVAIERTSPTEPTQVLRDSTLYSMGPQGLTVIDLSEPQSPNIVGEYQNPNWKEIAEDTRFDRNSLDSRATPNRYLDLAVAGDFAYIAASNHGLQVVDVSDPTGIREVGRFETDDRITRVVAGDHTVYALGVTDNIDGLRGIHNTVLSIEISRPNQPTLVSRVEQLSPSRRIQASAFGQALLLGNSQLHVIDPNGIFTFRIGERDNQQGSESATPAPEQPANLVPAIVLSREVDGEAVLVLADTQGNVLQEVHDLPQHQYGPGQFRIKVAVSPDGTQIAYEDSGQDQGNLYIRDIATGEDRPLVVSDESEATNPVWSPDGEWIAFENDRTGHSEIFIVRPDGSDLRQLTETEEGAGVPVWSPDGNHIAFLSPPSWEALGYQLDANPAEVTPFAIHVVNADGSNQHAIPEAEVFDPQSFATGNDPNSAQIWSPDSRRIVFTVYEAHEDRDGASPRLAIADVESGTVNVVPDVFAVSPAWSPSGYEIVYSAQEEASPPELGIYSPDTGKAHRLREHDYWLGSPTWSPEGDHIMYVTDQGIYVMDREEGETRMIAEAAIPWPPNAWVLAPGNPAEAIDTPNPTPTIISSGSGELPPSSFEDMSTDDITVDIPDDQMLAMAVQRWVDGRRVISVFDLDGNLLWEFDQIPNIESDDFPPTIVADVSPDGRSVAYQHNSEDDRSDIFVMNAEGGEPRQLTTTGNNYRPVWSPDGEQIAFLSDRAHGDERHENQRSEIFVMNRDGSDLRQLSDTPYGAGQIKWSHDGSMIAFASPGFHSSQPDEDNRQESPFQLYVVAVESGERRELEGATMEDLFGFGLSAQPWLTDNSGVFFEQGGRVFLASAAGSGVEAVDALPTGEENRQLRATASPDGKRIAFNWTQGDGSSRIGILNLEDGHVYGLGEELGSASHRSGHPTAATFPPPRVARRRRTCPKS